MRAEKFCDLWCLVKEVLAWGVQLLWPSELLTLLRSAFILSLVNGLAVFSCVRVVDSRGQMMGVTPPLWGVLVGRGGLTPPFQHLDRSLLGLEPLERFRLSKLTG